MSGGGGGSETTTTEPWEGQARHLKTVYGGALNHLYNSAYKRQYNEIGPDQRTDVTYKNTGIDAENFDQTRNLGLDAEATRTAVRTGGLAPFTNYEKEAQGRAVALARSGIDPNLKAAQRQLTNNAGISRLKGANPAYAHLNRTAQGDYLTPDSNPHLRGAVEASQRPTITNFNEHVLPGISGQFGASGRFGSGAHKAAINRATDDMTRNLSDSAAKTYAGAYGQERGMQQQAQMGLGQLDLEKNRALAEAVQRNAAISPALAAATRGQQTQNMALLEGVGGAQGDMAERLGQWAAAPYDFRQNELRQRVKDYAQVVQGTPILPTQTGGGGGGRNRAAGALGGAATGAYLGSSVGPWGTAAGAVVGGVGGYFL